MRLTEKQKMVAQNSVALDSRRSSELFNTVQKKIYIYIYILKKKKKKNGGYLGPRVFLGSGTRVGKFYPRRPLVIVHETGMKINIFYLYKF